MPGPWDKYASPAAEGPWAKYAQPSEAAPAKPEGWYDYIEGLAEKAAQGATANFAEEIAAGAGSLGNKAMRAVGVDVPEKSYGQILDEIRGRQQEFETRHPYQAMAAEIAGGVAPFAAAGPAALTSAPTWTGRVANSMKVGGTYGGLSGFGASEGGAENRLLGGAKGAAVGSVVTPLLADVALPAVSRVAATIPQAVKYAERSMLAAHDPETAAYRNIADKAVTSGLDFNKMRAEISPSGSAQLSARGFTDDDIANIISRQMQGETASAVAGDLTAQGKNITASTAQSYLKKYLDANPTPLNVLDVARQTAGEGGAGPLSRYGRASETIGGAEDSTSRQALLSRQELQPGRVSSIIEKRMGAGDFEAQKAANAKQLSAESQKAYKKFYSEPELATDQLGDLMEEPLFRRAVENAQRQERIDIIAENQKLQKAGKPTLPVPNIKEETQVFSPQLLDLVQRDLRLTAQGYSNPNEANYARNLREVFLDRIEQHYPSFEKNRQNYASGKLEQDAFDYGVKLSSQLGANTRQTLALYDQMTPAQQAIVRQSYGASLRDKVANTVQGGQAANRFTSDAFKQIIEKLYPKANKKLYSEGQALLKELRTEAITTRTKNFQLSGSITAEKLHDQELAGTAAEAASHAFTGNWMGVLRTLGKRLTQQIGSEGAKQSLKILTETDPAKLLPILTRLAKEAKTSGERQAYVASIRKLRAGTFRGASPAIGIQAGQLQAYTQPRNRLLDATTP